MGGTNKYYKTGQRIIPPRTRVQYGGKPTKTEKCPDKAHTNKANLDAVSSIYTKKRIGEAARNVQDFRCKKCKTKVTLDV